MLTAASSQSRLTCSRVQRPAAETSHGVLLICQDLELPLMLAFSKRDRTVRILGLHPHPRFAGQALVDEEGVVLPGTFSMRIRRFKTLDERIAYVARQLRESVALYRPDLIAIVRTAGCAWAEMMAGRVIASAKTTGVPVRVSPEEELDELFIEPDAVLCDRLGQSVTGTFFPKLAPSSWRLGGEGMRRRIRPVWKASAVALAALAEVRPAAVRSLALRTLPPGLAAFLDRVHPPTI